MRAASKLKGLNSRSKQTIIVNCTKRNSSKLEYHSPLLETSNLRPPVALGVSFQPFKRNQNPMQTDSKTTHMGTKWLFSLDRVRARRLWLQIIFYSSTRPKECCGFIKIPDSFKEVIYRLRALHFKDIFASKHQDFLKFGTCERPRCIIVAIMW